MSIHLFVGFRFPGLEIKCSIQTQIVDFVGDIGSDGLHVVGFGFGKLCVLRRCSSFKTEVHQQERNVEVALGIVLVPCCLHRFVGLSAIVIGPDVRPLMMLVVRQDQVQFVVLVLQ